MTTESTHVMIKSVAATVTAYFALALIIVLSSVGLIFGIIFHALCLGWDASADLVHDTQNSLTSKWRTKP